MNPDCKAFLHKSYSHSAELSRKKDEARSLLHLSLKTIAKDVVDLFKERFKEIDEVVIFADKITKQIK